MEMEEPMSVLNNIDKLDPKSALLLMDKLEPIAQPCITLIVPPTRTFPCIDAEDDKRQKDRRDIEEPIQHCFITDKFEPKKALFRRLTELLIIFCCITEIIPPI
jgi:hypothetical protein